MTRALLPAACMLVMGPFAPGAGRAVEDVADVLDPGAPAAEIGASYDLESRCWELLETYEEARDYVEPPRPVGRVLCPLVTPPPRAPVPEAAKLEAAEIAAIAEDLLAEGDPGMALVLFEEALVLLGAPPPES